MKVLAISITLLLLPNLAYAKKKLIDEYGVNLFKAEKVYTLTNLHPDQANARLYSTNYQQPGLIPRCTEVKLQKINRKVLIFNVTSFDKEYHYLYAPKSTPEPLAMHLKEVFGRQCDPNSVKKMSKFDQSGILQGAALIGMTKEGVRLAMGRPPKHVTPKLESPVWTYWTNRFRRKVITFNEKGHVSKIQ